LLLLYCWCDEFLATDFTVVVLVEAFETALETSPARLAGLVLFEGEKLVFVGVPTAE